MHPDEVVVDEATARALVSEQFPQWGRLAISAVPSAGTVNAIFRLGDALALRFPRIPSGVLQLEKERTWLERLAPRLPFSMPVPIATGRPGGGYPWEWGVYPWLPGRDLDSSPGADPGEVARDLAGFVNALHSIDAFGGPPPGEHNFFRGVPLRQRAEAVRQALEDAPDVVDVGAAEAAWRRALSAPAWSGTPVWIHGDLSGGNLLISDGRLTGIIDFGGLGVGDPSCDLMVGWTLFDARSRRVFRALVDVDDATWERARGWALSWALIALPYYLDTNPVIARNALRAIDEIHAD